MLDFIGIGAQKSGTTWLFERLKMHPEIHFPHVKEIGFWDTHYPRYLKDKTYKRGLNWYRNLFNHYEATLEQPATEALEPYRQSWFDRVMEKLDGSVPIIPPSSAREAYQHTLKLGEISPSYCYFDNPDTIAAVKQFAPHTRILYIMRDPIERAWSAAQMAVKRAEMKPEEASDQWYIDHFHSQLSLKYGNYERAIEDWLAAFPQEQVLLLQFEDIATHPQEVLRKCCAHIGVQRTDYFDNLPPERLREKVFAGTGAQLRESLLPTLHSLYDGQIERLRARYGIEFKSA